MNKDEEKLYRETIEKAAIAIGTSPYYIEKCIEMLLYAFGSSPDDIERFRQSSCYLYN